MDRKVFKSSGLPIRRSIELLPEIFQTNANDKFLGATLDALTQPGTLEKLSGYIGRKYGVTYDPSETYVDNDGTLRDAYQLEPAVVVKKNNRVSEFYDYIDFKNQLKFFGNNLERDDLITQEDVHSWNPPIDWDKFVNYREYFWQPVGPDSVTVLGQAREIISSYRVRTNSNSEWIFYPDGLKKNPSLTLYRGQTYEFDVNAPGDPFYIRSSNVSGDQSNYNKGVVGNGIEVGKVTFEVPNDAPELLYYQSGSDRNRIGIFRIAEVKDNTFLDVERDILGKQKYISSNGVSFTNGLRVKFEGQTSPEKYSRDSWVIEGVGDSIRLINWEEIELPPISNPNPEVLFDNGGFDDQPFDESLSYPRNKDYITINRASKDKNPWSRYNRWFHRSVLEYTAQLNNTSPRLDETLRAKRPVIEFDADLQLFNHGAVAKTSVDLIDDFTTDVFSTIEGSPGYNIDGEPVTDGFRILFTADKDPLVKNKIFVVKFITVQTSSNIVNRRQISLIESEDSVSSLGECLVVKRGKINGSSMFHYDGTMWIKSQEKPVVNLPPKFDCFDSDGISFGDSSKYDTSSFSGSEIISYKISTSGPTDSELGFALSYLNINNSGDIQFEFDFDSDQFTYQNNFSIVQEKVNKGFVRFNRSLTDYEYANGWVRTDKRFLQPIIETIVVTEESSSVFSQACDWSNSTREKIVCYVNGISTPVTGTNLANNKKEILFGNRLAVGDIVTVKVYTDAVPDNGYYEIPYALERNPLNQDLVNFTLGQVNDHLGTIIEVLDGFEGIFPGLGNLKDLVDYEQYGRRFVKHSSVPAVSINLLCDKEVNVIKAIQYAANEYEKFKNNFLTLAIELPYEDGDVVRFVDRIIDTISQSKNVKTSFSDSDMIGSGAFSKIEYTVEDTGINTFALGEKFDLSVVSSKAVYVYINGEQQLINFDYSFDSTFGFVRILKELNEGDQITIKEYFTTSFNFIPPTPTKLGLYKKFLPEKFIDTTYIEPKLVIRGHDGSITIAFNDFRDDLILELEKRIYNNLKLTYDENLFDIDSVVSSFYNTGLISLDDFNQVINQEFLRWSTYVDQDSTVNNFYNSSNPFTYTYSNVLDNSTNKKLPQFWRGMYQAVFDTDRPHLAPWEMLGFSEKPNWWEDEYGPAPYTSGNLLLWEDLRDGIIKQGARQGTYTRYARPNLLEILPVDDEGNLKSPVEINILRNYSSLNNQAKFKFGDQAPVENAWRKSSSYPFVVIFALCLLRPFEFIPLSLDRNYIRRNRIDQIVGKETSYFLRIDDIISNISTDLTPTGLLYYIENYLKVDLKDKSILKEKLENFDVRLSNKIGGFVDKSQQKYLLDSKNPQSTTSNVFIPPEDFEIFFDVSTPIRNVTYSGVIIEKSDRGWLISGYDKQNTYFDYYPILPTNYDPKIVVGGVSENFVTWKENQFYSRGIIVRFSESFYRSLVSHTSVNSFEATKWIKIDKVPLVGAVEASKRSFFDRTETQRIPYGTNLLTIQDVVDFLLGYGEYLKDQGIQFEEYSNDLQAVANWETSAKEFMFWTTHNWAPGAVISLSPGAIKLKINSTGGVANNILDSFFDYTILKSDGTKLSPENIDVFRGYNEFHIVPVNIRDGIYFAKVSYLLKEHVVIFNDRTMFNDVIFDKGPGYRQQRIKVIGFRTTDWDGDYTSPGFVFDDVNIQTWTPFIDYKLGDIVRYREFNYVSKINQPGKSEFDNSNWEKLDSTPTTGLVSNFEYKINQFEDFYDLDSEGLGSSQRDLARHFVAYQPREYLQDLAEDPVTQYRLYSGFVKEKGTANAVKKVFDKLSKVDADAVEINEEWAFRVGQIGGTDQYDEIEFKIGKDKFKLNPQPIILNNRSIDQNVYKNYIVLDDSNYEIGDSKNTVIQTQLSDNTQQGAGYVNVSDVDFVIENFDQLIGNDISEFKDGSTIWITFETSGWNVLRYKVTDITVTAVAALDLRRVSLKTIRPHKLKVGTLIGLTNIQNLQGFFKISAVNSDTIIVDTNGFETEPEIDQSSFCNIGVFLPARIATPAELIKEDFSILPLGSKVWLDSSNNNTWQVLERNKQFSKSEIAEYGISLPSKIGSSTAYVPLRDQVIVSNPGNPLNIAAAPAIVVYNQGVDGLVPTQILSPISDIAPELSGSYGTSITTSADGRWLIVGSPTASGIPSGFKGLFNSLGQYNTDDTVISGGKLWKAKKPIFPDGSTLEITLSNEDWEPETLHQAQPFAKGRVDTNQGYPRQGTVDIFEFTRGQWNYRSTLISPRPDAGELFGSSISIGKQEGIEGTSGDVTLIVKAIDTNGGITLVDAVGVSGLKDTVYENISGFDISTPGSGASFDVIKSSGSYIVTVRNGGTRYAIGDQIKILGTQIGGNSPANDLTVTVTAITAGGEILGSATYANLTGINSDTPFKEAVFNVNRLRTSYTVSIADPGVGYSGRSIVSYAGRIYGCIKNTQTDRGVWDSTAVYYSGDVVKYPERSSSYYRVKDGIGDNVVEVQFVLPTDTEYWEVSGPILPTNTEYWEEVPTGLFASLARPWAAFITSTADGNLGDLVKYTSGSTILISGSQLGGESPSNDLLIRVNPNLPITTVGTSEGNNSIVVGSTSQLRVDQPVVFSGSVAGGLSAGTQYYIKEILNSQAFTIYSDTETKAVIPLTSTSSPRINPMRFIDNSIRNISISGTAKSGISFSGSSVGVGSFFDIIGQDISAPGSGAIFELVRDQGRYTATVNVRGSRYNVGDEIKILGKDIGGVPESYFMAISAPGSLLNRGRVYLYQYDGISWKQLEDRNFVGIFNSAKNYTSGSIVWYDNNYWKANEVYLAGDNTPGEDDSVWELSESVNTGILPAQSSYQNDGSSLEAGIIDQQSPELLNIGDRYGISTSMSSDASVLVVGAPFADSSDYENYKGAWKSFQTYEKDDIVKILENGVPAYFKLLTLTSTGELPVNGATWNKLTESPEFDTGAVFVYKKNSDNIFELVQIIDDDTIASDDLEAGDELGYKVTLNNEGDLLLVSAPDADIKNKDKGAVFVFQWNNNSFEILQRLESYSLDFFERFGDEISISPTSDTLAISAGTSIASNLVRFDSGSTTFDFLSTRFKDIVGVTGKVYIFNRYGSKYVLSEIFDENLTSGESFGKSISCFDDRIIIGSPLYKSEDPAFLGETIGRVQVFRKLSKVNAWEPIREQSPVVNLQTLKSLVFFDPDKNIKLGDIDIIDPLRGKILSVAEQEIKFKTSYDPAYYTTDDNISNGQAWFKDQVGFVWWDTSTVKWIQYNQDDISFRIGNWNQQVFGSSIDVYEWVESDYLPSQWAAISNTAEGFSLGVTGTPLDITDSRYSVLETLDKITGQVSSRKFYFWVKNKLDLPLNKTFRKISTAAISSYIENPISTGITFATLIDADKIAIYNPSMTITGDNVSIIVQFYKDTKNINQIHREYQLLTEGIADSIPSQDLENKWIDSLIGYDITGKEVPDSALPVKFKYGILNKPRQGMFVDRNGAVKITIEFINNILRSQPYSELLDFTKLNSFDQYPSPVKNLYDREVDSYDELSLISTSKIKPALLKANIINGHINTIDILDSGYGYRVSPPIIITGNGSGAKFRANIDKLGRITSVDVLNQGSRYTFANLSVRQFSVLVKFDRTVRNYWSIYSWNEKAQEFYRSASQSFDTRNYWKKIDWWKLGFSEKSRIKFEIPGLYAEPDVSLEIGDLLRIKEYGAGNWAVLERVEPVNSTILEKYRLVGRYQGTIEILTDFINTKEKSSGYDLTQSYDSQGYDTSAAKEFRIILDSVKNEIFVDDAQAEWNKLFFANVHYAFSEQLYIDWAFKTSFVNAVHNVGNLSKKVTYKNDNLSSYQKYIEEVKPYRTKIREYTSRYTSIENTNTSFTDFDVPSVYNPLTKKIEPVKLISTEIDTYPWKWWLDNYKYSVIDIIISNPGRNYRTVPIVIFEGGGGTGAKARAFVSNGRLSKIVLLDGGSGYTSAPTIKIVGGIGTNLENTAKAVAIIGNSKARNFNLSLKFDRISKVPTFNNLSIDEKFIETETFDGTGSKTVFNLKYPTTVDKSKISVVIKNKAEINNSSGIKLLSNQYNVENYDELIDRFTTNRGRLIINVAPLLTEVVIVTYEINDKSLDYLNRIDKYYTPKAGMPGFEKIEKYDENGNVIEVQNDYTQLVTGLDYGGVIVQGATLDVSGGWDALPWFTEGWDSAEALNSDFYVTADGTSNIFVLPEMPVTGQMINVYLKRKDESVFVRIDYPQGEPGRPDSALMDTFIGDGSTSAVTIPENISIEDGDILIFRPDNSDGSLSINDRNLIDTEISGGSLTSNTTGTPVFDAPNVIDGAYSTATGLSADEIRIDGSNFISPLQVPAPEENIPGQVLEAVSIKVFHSDRVGSPTVLSRIYTADGTNTLFDIGQSVLEQNSVIVFVDKIKKVNETDYVFEPLTQNIRFINSPVLNSVIEIFSINVGGIEILDYRDFIGDGSNRYFLTAANYQETGRVFATVDYVSTPVNFINSNGIVNDIDKTLVEFGIAPVQDSKVAIIVLSTNSIDADSIVRVNYQTVNITDVNQRVYQISNFVTSNASPTGNVIVDLNDTLLRCIDTVIQTYDGTNNVVSVGIDPFKPFGSIVQSQVKAYINNTLLVFGLEYEFTAASNTVTIIKRLNHGDIIRVETYDDNQFEIIDDEIILSNDLTLTAGDKLNIVWFNQYSSVDLVKDRKTGGKLNYPLQRSAIGISYIWVYKNGQRLTPDVDFYIDYPKNTVYLKDENTDQDEIEIISFASQVYKEPFAYEIFKDALNSNHFTRYAIGNISLSKDLYYYDTEIELNDASLLPEPRLKLPGVILINGERIEYLSKQGNILKNLRRGLYGTAIPTVHAIDSVVVNVSYTEIVPYRETQDRYDFVSDGSSYIYLGLPFIPPARKDSAGNPVEFTYVDTIPDGFYPCDAIEVFVAGKRLRKDIATIFDPTRGSYSPAADVTLEAEFSVDGSSLGIRLTSAPPAGTRITVVRRTGKTWYDFGDDSVSSGVTLSQNTTPVAKFLQQSTTKLL